MDVSTSCFRNSEIYDEKSLEVILHTLAVAGVTLLSLLAVFSWDYAIIQITELGSSMQLQAITILSVSIALMYTVK